jgi:hypothetical protein
VVAAGLTVALPEAGREPPPGDMEIDVAPETLQPRVEFPPELMLAGLAVKKLITGNEAGGAEATVTVTCRVTGPAALAAVSV